MVTKTNVSDLGDGTVVVEAPSVEAALDAVTKEFGPTATIVDAERVNRGGVGGFFSKEIYRVVVQPTGTGPALSSPAVSSPVLSSPASPNPIDVVRGTASLAQDGAVDLRDAVGQDGPMSAVDRALADVEMSEAESGSGFEGTDIAIIDEVSGAPTFGEALRAELRLRGRRPATTAEIAQDNSPLLEQTELNRPAALDPMQVVDLRSPTRDLPASVPTSHGAPVPDTAVVVPAQQSRHPLGRTTGVCPLGSGPVLWSADALSRVGLPYTLIRPLAELDPADDLAWVYRLAESVAGLCGPVDTTDVVLMGRNVGVLANALDLRVAVSPEAPAHTGSVAVETDLTEFNATYLENVAAGRAIHLFCGAGGDYMPGNLVAVSWCGDHLSSALHVAIETGARLGYMVRDDETIRVTPFELALAVRARLARG
ncbi:MAG: hypothetical protein GXP35_08475 [Actinobacteria bacterium]|nr:hypothetical protein [Actinomycetota bacterium]